MPETPDIVERLKLLAQSSGRSGGKTICFDAARTIELLRAECAWGRAMNDHKYTDDPDSPDNSTGGRLVDAYESARAATDAAGAMGRKP